MVAQPESLEPFVSPANYLAFERAAEFRSEYFNGRIYAMAGASKEHVRIVTRTASLLDAQLSGKTCEPFSTDMCVKINTLDDYVYPDVIVACEPQFEDDCFDTLLNPRVILEVLSPSTANFDAGDKFAHYQRLPSLFDYVLIAQSEPRVQHFARQGDSSWLLQIAEGLPAQIEIASIACVLRLADIYERVPFENA